MASRSTSRTGTLWTYTDEDVLWDNAGQETSSEIARRLRRTRKAVQRKAEKLHLSLNRNY